MPFRRNGSFRTGYPSRANYLYRYYEVNTGFRESSDFTRIEKWGQNILDSWPDLDAAGFWTVNGGHLGSNECNAIRGTDGHQFRPEIDRSSPLWVFDPNLCRSIKLDFKVSERMEQL